MQILGPSAWARVDYSRGTQSDLDTHADTLLIITGFLDPIHPLPRNPTSSLILY